MQMLAKPSLATPPAKPGRRRKPSGMEGVRAALQGGFRSVPAVGYACRTAEIPAVVEGRRAACRVRDGAGCGWEG